MYKDKIQENMRMIFLCRSINQSRGRRADRDHVQEQSSRPYSITPHGVKASGAHVPVKPGEKNYAENYAKTKASQKQRH